MCGLTRAPCQRDAKMGRLSRDHLANGDVVTHTRTEAYAGHRASGPLSRRSFSPISIRSSARSVNRVAFRRVMAVWSSLSNAMACSKSCTANSTNLRRLCWLARNNTASVRCCRHLMKTNCCCCVRIGLIVRRTCENKRQGFPVRVFPVRGFPTAGTFHSRGDTFRRRLAGMGIGEVLSSPSSPGKIHMRERLIGSIRRECLGSRHRPRREASATAPHEYFSYYHGARTHLA